MKISSLWKTALSVCHGLGEVYNGVKIELESTKLQHVLTSSINGEYSSVGCIKLGCICIEASFILLMKCPYHAKRLIHSNLYIQSPAV